MWLNMVPGKPHRDVDDVISLPVKLAYEDISFTVFVRVHEKHADRSYIEAPHAVTLGESVTKTIIKDATEWVKHQEIEDRRDW